jgi:photosystem II stability/assembly factor-like uncharacterized protein
MSDYRDLLEQERRRFRMPGGSMQGLERRRDRRRRNRRITSGIVALIIATVGIGAGVYALRPTGEAKPAVTPTPTVTPPAVSRALPAPSGPIQFVDSRTGWAVGPNAEILATVDGGTTWTGQYGGPLKIVGVQFVDDLHGWAVGEGGDLLRTVDGGDTWELVQLDEELHTAQFVDASIGWATGFIGHGGPSSSLFMSSDGGMTWATQRPGNVEVVDSVCAASKDLIWAAGHGRDGASLVMSDDGGATWKGTSLGIPQSELGTDTLSCSGVDAWVLGTDGGAAGHLPYVLFSAKAGPKVTPVLQEAGTRPMGTAKGIVDAQDPYPGPFVAFDARNALFVGWCPACGNSMALYATTDGGKRWERAELASQGASPLGMSFADRDHGWILFQKVGSKGPEWTVMATSDGGKTWSTLG